MNSLLSRLVIEATRAPEFIDITDRVVDYVRESSVRNGLVCVFSKHTTAAIKINENEPLLIQDMEELLTSVAPQDGTYRHNDFTVRTINMTDEECPNGHAHCQQLFLPTSETIPLIDGELQFGRWQRIFMIELDRPRPREVLISIMGE
ncbi:MAG: secondary thiamine-phosphate synthase enzyme YjbQ [Chloroflexi bacterium]|nr:secondary thiamine-phosphate synthase enzyme YjbQ [Chloroflexota bacterium]